MPCRRGPRPSSFSEARKRQFFRLDGAKPPNARAATALAKSQAYQDAARGRDDGEKRQSPGAPRPRKGPTISGAV